MAYCYYNGIGTTNDFRKGSYWCRKAANAENPNAQTLLADSLNRGQGFLIDKHEALKYYFRAIDNGCYDGYSSMREMFRV